MKSKIYISSIVLVLFLLLGFIVKPLGWKKYDYAQAYFSINFPQTPKAEKAGYFNQLTSSDKGIAYQVLYLKEDMDISSQTDDVWFDQAFGAFGGKQEGQSKKLTKEGLKGQQRKLKVGKMNGILQVWLGKKRIYTLAVFEQNDYPSTTKCNTFFDSFDYTFSQTGNTEVATNSSQSSSNSSSASIKKDANFDVSDYFKLKSFPHISNIKTLDGWKGYFMLDMFVENDLPDVREKMDQYGEDYFKKSYAGGEALDFMNQELPTLYPLFPQIIDQYLKGVSTTPAAKGEDNFDGQPRLMYLKKVEELAEDFVYINPTSETKAVYQKAKAIYEEAIEKAPFVKGEYYKNNLGKVVLFKKELVIGTGSKTEATDILSPNAGLFLVAYFPHPLNSGQRHLEMKWKVKDGIVHSQKIFIWKKDEESFLKNNGAIGFNVFPDVEKLDYKSGYQYDVHLNVLKYLLNLSDGIHQVEVGFTRNHMANTSAEVGYNAFEFTIDAQARKTIQIMYDKLLEKRIATVVLPQSCEDDSHMISNKDGFKKYGRLLKFVHTGTPGAVKDPKWPHPLIGYGTSGWAVLEKPNGTIEIIPIGLYKRVGVSVWSFTSLDTMPSLFDMKGRSNIFDGRGEYGFLMKKENLNKCAEWE